MSQYHLDGFALVVGAAGGIGEEVAYSFAEAGVKGILLADINAEAAEKAMVKSKSLASNPSCRCIFTTVDVTDLQSVEKMVKLMVKEFGRIDYCVNAAGVDVATYCPIDQTDPDDYDRVMAINTKGMFLVIRAVAQVMKSQEPTIINLGRHGDRDAGRGSIVNVSSTMAVVAVEGKIAYATSKHANTGVTRAAVMDYKSVGIRTNQVCPIWVRTPMYTEECRRVPQTSQVVEGLSSVKRPIEPDEVAAACLYLCTPGAVAVNGLTLTIDTGLTAGPMVI
ncbi:oxidoreductase [Nemania abortiva]|nr:oxidoreductase [Nemania abortiva]